MARQLFKASTLSHIFFLYLQNLSLEISEFSLHNLLHYTHFPEKPPATPSSIEDAVLF